MKEVVISELKVYVVGIVSDETFENMVELRDAKLLSDELPVIREEESADDADKVPDGAGVVTPILDDPEPFEVETEAVMSVAGYVPLKPGIDDVPLYSAPELVPKNKELRLLRMPPVLDDEATG